MLFLIPIQLPEFLMYFAHAAFSSYNCLPVLGLVTRGTFTQSDTYKQVWQLTWLEMVIITANFCQEQTGTLAWFSDGLRLLSLTPSSQWEQAISDRLKIGLTGTLAREGKHCACASVAHTIKTYSSSCSTKRQVACAKMSTISFSHERK